MTCVHAQHIQLKNVDFEPTDIDHLYHE